MLSFENFEHSVTCSSPDQNQAQEKIKNLVKKDNQVAHKEEIKTPMTLTRIQTTDLEEIDYDKDVKQAQDLLKDI